MRLTTDDWLLLEVSTGYSDDFLNEVLGTLSYLESRLDQEEAIMHVRLKKELLMVIRCNPSSSNH